MPLTIESLYYGMWLNQRRAERGFLDDVSLPWGQQLAVMFQILCALVLDVPAVADCLTNCHGVSPDVLLAVEPWGHVYHTGIEYGCRSSDRMGAYVHTLAFDQPTSTDAPGALLLQQTPSHSRDVSPGRNSTGVPDPASYDGIPSVRPAPFHLYLTEEMHSGVK